MLDLARRVAAEETDATGALVDGTSKVVGTAEALTPGSFSKVAVLAEQAVERACLVEDGKIVVATLGILGVGEFGKL
jgi:hypothetical protein